MYKRDVVMFDLVSLTVGIPSFPLGDSLPGNANSLRYIFLRKFIKLPQGGQVAGNITFLLFHIFHTSCNHNTPYSP